MTAVILDDFSAPWNADSSGLWTLSLDAGYIGATAMQIAASSGSAADPAPFAERQFSSPIDLSAYDELRFWFRSSRGGDGSPSRPFYLIFEADTLPSGGTPWSRLIPVTKAETWELHGLWLADMPASLRAAVGVLRLRSLDPTIAFVASIDHLIATTPEPVQDVESALHGRLHERFEVTTGGGPLTVPAVFDLPESEPDAAMPFIRITPWSLRYVPAGRESGEVIDNFTAEGAYVSAPAERLSLQYSVDVFAAERAQKASLFEQILRDLLLNPYLVVNNERLEAVLFSPDVELLAALTAARRMPLFFEVTASLEVVTRQFRPWAVPFLVTAPADGRETAEITVP